MDQDPLHLHQILVQCLKKNEAFPAKSLMAGLSPQDWQNLIQLAAMQRITPFLWHCLKQKDLQALLPESVAELFRDATRRNALNNLRLNSDLSRLLTALEKENIPLILLKGIVMANTVYENIGLREMNDIDVLARPADLERIAEILTSMGYHPMQPYSIDVICQTGHHLPRFIKKNAAHFEIHWTLANPGTGYDMDPQELWQQARSVQIAGHKTQTLCVEDMLLHLCLHTSYLHPFSFGLRPFCDIGQLIDRAGSSLNWRTVTHRAISRKWQRGVYAALRLAVELAEAAVPQKVLDELQPEDLSDSILEMIRTQIFTNKYFAASIPAPFAELLKSRRLTDKIKIFIRRVFLPRAIIASVYGVPINSLKLYTCYPRRLFDVLGRHKDTLKKYQKKNTSVESLAERTLAISDWLKSS